MSGRDGYDYKALIQMRDGLQQAPAIIDRELKKGARAVAEKFVRDVAKNSPVDFGLLASSWEYELEINGQSYIIIIWNSAQGENGEYYMGFVNDGHRQEVGRYVPAIGKRLVKEWVEGQFFLDYTEHDILNQMPKVKKRIESAIVKEIKNAMG